MLGYHFLHDPSPLTPHLTILTGASRGMGFAMARQLLTAGNTLLCISRTSQEALAQHAARTGATLLQWTHDLAEALRSARGWKAG